jgi:hypothetical protein
MHQEKTRQNINFEVPLTETITCKITPEEKANLVAISNQNLISISETLRNLMRDHLCDYAISENLHKYMKISSIIDAILIEKAVILSRKATNQAKMIEILTDLEVFFKTPLKQLDYDTAKNNRLQVDKAMGEIFKWDSFLFEYLEPQYDRIKKTKGYNAVDALIKLPKKV